MKHQNLAEALAAAQAEMGHAHFDSVNPHFRSKFASLPSVIDAAKPLAAHGIAFIQHSRPQEKGVGIETVLYGYGEQIGTGVVPVPVDKSNAHGVGAAMTYAKRYSLSMALGIGADEDDDGNAAVATPKKAKSVVQTVIEEENLQGDKVEANARAVALSGIDNDDELLEAWDEVKEDNDFTVLVWQELNSQVRSRIKRLDKERKDAAVAVEIAEVAEAKKVTA